MNNGTPAWLHRPRQRLPRVVKPFNRETLNSYLRRLARVNYLEVRDLRRYVAGSPSGRVEPLWLSIATGLNGRMLSLRLPELPSPSYSQFPTGLACRFCLARRNVFDPVVYYRDSEVNVCLRHRIWVGGNQPGTQLDLSALPELHTAQRRHYKLVRRYGGGLTANAFHSANGIVIGWTERNAWSHHRTRRLRAAFPDRYRHITMNSTEADIANYPEVVSLASVLISHYWTSKAITLGRTVESLHEFHAEVARRLNIGIDLGTGNPLANWINHKQNALEHQHYLRDRTGTVARPASSIVAEQPAAS